MVHCMIDPARIGWADNVQYVETLGLEKKAPTEDEHHVALVPSLSDVLNLLYAKVAKTRTTAERRKRRASREARKKIGDIYGGKRKKAQGQDQDATATSMYACVSFRSFRAGK